MSLDLKSVRKRPRKSFDKKCEVKSQTLFRLHKNFQKQNVDKADCKFWNGHKGEVPLLLIHQAGTVIISKWPNTSQYIYWSITSFECLLFLAVLHSVYVMLFSPNKLFSMTECCLWTKHKSHEDVCDFNLHAANEGHSEKHSSVGG